MGRLRRTIESRDPRQQILRVGLRVGVVVPLGFGFAELVIGNSQASLFVGFGLFALLAMANFGGPPRRRLTAYVVTTLVCLPLIVGGTALSGNPWAGAAAALLVGFSVRFAGVFGGYTAAAGITVILSFILAVAIDAPLSSLGARLGGWLGAGALATAGAMLLWPVYERNRLLRSLGGVCEGLALSLIHI